MPYGVVPEHRSENIVPFGQAMTEYWTARNRFEFKISELHEINIDEELAHFEWCIQRYVHAKHAELTPETAATKPIEAGRGDLMTADEFEEGVFASALINYDGWGNYATATEVSRLVVRPSDIAEGFFYPNWTHVLWYNR